MPLLRGALIEPPHTFPHLEVDRYPGGPEEVASRTRAAWQMPLGPVRNTVNLVEDAGGIVVRTSLATQKLDAVSQWFPGQVPFVFVNADATAGDRVRFTMAHEIGHMVMQNYASLDPEDEANRFAAEFLMPAAEIKRDLYDLTIPKAARLKFHWKTSIQSIIRRAKTLKTISDWKYRSLCIEVNKLQIRKSEPYPIPVEGPTSLPELIDLHFDRLHMTTKQVCGMMDIFEDEFRERFIAGPRGNPGLKVVG